MTVYLVKALKYPSHNISIPDFITFAKSSTHSSCTNYSTISVDNYLPSFLFNWVVRLWNRLPVIHLSGSVVHIRCKITKHVWNHFQVHFDLDNSSGASPNYFGKETSLRRYVVLVQCGQHTVQPESFVGINFGGFEKDDISRI